MPAAVTEAAALAGNPAAPTPNLTQVRNWVSQNRAMLVSVSTSPNFRRALVGNGTMGALLLNGRLGVTGPPIPGLAAWTIPAGVQMASDHLDHWHVEAGF